MDNYFFETSKRIANDFLQSIVFIDDKAFVQEGPNHHEFDAKQITRVFANSRKICAVYNPETLSDIDNLAQLAKKNDVTVIDWQIILKEEIVVSGEEDAEEDDPRGPHTMKIIREILSDPLTGQGSLKLILIYTGEIDLPGITDEIFKHLQALSVEKLQKGDCSVFTDNIKILIVAKPTSDYTTDESKFKYNPKLNDKIVAYDKLPDFILTKFTEMTSGLLSNFVLQSLTAIRGNTFRLIKLYRKELDPSFLVHRLLLPNPEDTKEQLVEILSHSIEALLNYNDVGDSISLDRIKDWLDQYELSEKITVSNKEIELNNTLLKNLFEDGISSALEKLWKEKGYGDTSKNLSSSFQDKLHHVGSSFLINDGNSEKVDSEFSILTHHKSNLKQPSITPRLTLGTLIKQLPKKQTAAKGANDQQDDRFFLCIQARCDSVRVDSLRKFLFLPLQKVVGNSKFSFVTEDESGFVRLNLVKEAFELRTIKFLPNEDNQVVLAEESKGQFYFKSNHGEQFKWLADLKDAHAQREANAFSAKISRVGLDESEWLRRWR